MAPSSKSEHTICNLFLLPSVDALLQKPQTPLAHRGARELQTLRDRAVGLAVGRRQHDARPRNALDFWIAT